jgi:hypothetical protein
LEQKTKTGAILAFEVDMSVAQLCRRIGEIMFIIA